MMPTLKITSTQDGKRLDVILARAYRDYSRAYLQKWIREGRVTKSGEKHALIPNYRVHAGDTIEVADFASSSSPTGSGAPAPGGAGHAPRSPVASGRGGGTTVSLKDFGTAKMGPPSAATGDDGIKILFEDASILVLNKPAGLVVHPAPSHKGATLVDWLEDYMGPKVTGLFSDATRLGVVHRLDKDTTGVLVVAKTVSAQHLISKQFQDRRIQKTYAAFIEGIPQADQGIISAPVGRSHSAPSRMAVSSSGRPSETTFEVVQSYKEVSLVSLHPKTGRTHQIRVHCAAIGHPIVGDRVYGASPKWAKDFGIVRPLLHAERLEFIHPSTHKKVHFTAPWPKDMKKALTLFRGTVKVLLVVALFVGAGASAYAQEADSANTAVPRPRTAKRASGEPSGSASTGSIKSLKRDMSALHDQFKSLIEEVSALQDRVTGLQTGLDTLDASRRLRDLEKAISDLNGKGSSTTNVAEESKSQVLDLGRKLKSQQDILDQLRDQVDRLQQALIQKNTRQEAAPPVEGEKK